MKNKSLIISVGGVASWLRLSAHRGHSCPSSPPRRGHQEAHRVPCCLWPPPGLGDGGQLGRASNFRRARLSLGTYDAQEFSGGTDSCWWGWEGTGRGRGKYIFKDNLEANIIFILIYPQSSLTRPQTCLMSRDCKMATNPTCLPLHSL